MESTNANPISSDPSRPVCLITGASRGIGKAIARVFAKAGYDLILTCSKTLPELEAFARELEPYEIRCQAFQIDVGDPAQVEALFQKVTCLDVLVNNAGISYVGLLHEMSPEAWRHVLSTNLDSCFYACKYSIPLMLQNHAGRIINISSVWASMPSPRRLRRSLPPATFKSMQSPVA